MSVRRGRVVNEVEGGGWGSVENTAMKLISLACAAIAQLKSSWHVQNTHTTLIHTCTHIHTPGALPGMPAGMTTLLMMMTMATIALWQQQLMKEPGNVVNSSRHTCCVCVCVSVCIEHMLLCALSCHWQAHILFFPSLQLPKSVCVQRSHTSHSLRQLGLPT